MTVELEPAELLAQTVYEVSGVTVSGVPQMLPLLVPNERPEGKVALMAQLVISPPVLAAMMVEIVVPLV